MATTDKTYFQNLFVQGSTQLNFLLLSQRNMILIFAFSITFLVFSVDFRKRLLVRLIMFCLLVYSVALGILSTINYNKYIKKTEKELDSEKNADIGEDVSDEIELLKDWQKWVYFSYVLLGVNALIIIFYIMFEIGAYDPSGIDQTSISKQTSSRSKRVKN